VAWQPTLQRRRSDAPRTVTQTIATGRGKHEYQHKLKLKLKLINHYSPITSPSKCKRSWTSKFALTFGGGVFSQSVSAPCRSH
jgi:hypothetical protein